MREDMHELQVRPSDLQRYKRLLASAADKPVRIIQKGNAPDITMVSHQVWCDAATAKGWIVRLSGVVNYAAARFLNKPKPVCPAEFSWLTLFDDQGVREFVDELSGAISLASQGVTKWSTVDAIVKEWINTAALLEN